MSPISRLHREHDISIYKWNKRSSDAIFYCPGDCLLCRLTSYATELSIATALWHLFPYSTNNDRSKRDNMHIKRMLEVFYCWIPSKEFSIFRSGPDKRRELSGAQLGESDATTKMERPQAAANTNNSMREGVWYPRCMKVINWLLCIGEHSSANQANQPLILGYVSHTAGCNRAFLIMFALPRQIHVPIHVSRCCVYAFACLMACMQSLVPISLFSR